MSVFLSKTVQKMLSPEKLECTVYIYPDVEESASVFGHVILLLII